MKIALITGVTGQDGAYLSEFLLKKGYEVHGIKRRSSLFNTQRIDHLYEDPHVNHRHFVLHYGDLTDSTNIIRIIQEVQPDEIYNLGAQSHVQVSFETPEYTANVDALGTLRVLEAVRLLGLAKKTRIYQASTSELYGKVQEIPQKETTPFYPRSPYGVAKLYGYWIIVNYREAYDMYACNGILFNHETIAGFMPMLFKIGEHGPVDIKPISEIAQHHTNHGKISIDESRNCYQETRVSEDLYVWDAKGWTRVMYVSGYPHQKDTENKKPRFVVAKNAAYMATSSHVCIMEDGQEKTFGEITPGDRVNLVEYPASPVFFPNIGLEEARLLGFIVGDGYRRGHKLQLTSKEKDKLEMYEKIWLSLDPANTVHYWTTKSGFKEESDIWQLRLNNASQWVAQFDIYDTNRFKRVPYQILNAPLSVQTAFLEGYQHADGLKSNASRYEFRNFKTNSATLAAGLLYLLNIVTGQDYNINVETAEKEGKPRLYYSLNILSNSSLGQNHRNSVGKYDNVLELEREGHGQRAIHRQTSISRTFIRKVQNGYVPDDSHHLTIPKNEVKKIIEMPDYKGWFYDLTTESGTFHCGIGQGHVHNSPLRGETFVTRKITRAVANIAQGYQQKLYLGNLDARRDWGHARDYVEAMWLMLQQGKPEDFVIATGVTTSVREFVRLSFLEVGIELAFDGNDENEVGIVTASYHPDFPIEVGRTVVAVDPRYYRPTEVDLLIGDPERAMHKLGWKPKHDIQSLVAEMIAADMVLVKKEFILRTAMQGDHDA